MNALDEIEGGTGESLSYLRELFRSLDGVEGRSVGIRCNSFYYFWGKCQGKGRDVWGRMSKLGITEKIGPAETKNGWGREDVTGGITL